MKILNLVVAILYSVFLLLILGSTTDSETAVGILILSAPVVVNWISFAYWPKI